MSDNVLVKFVAGTCIGFSFILVGNAITQTYMTVPALVVDFPKPGTAEHTSRARLIGKQWPLCWSVGNVFFRPISTFGIIGYGFSAYTLYREGPLARADWRWFAVAAALHLTTVVHSAINMQPINDKLEALAERTPEKELVQAEGIARRWASWNRVRLVTPVLAGGLALWQLIQ
ncbi:hypothetical protein DM02DRAFT_662547 [Periconia macrospinosa]|uniref:DUF1772-domain-containing protein n=1 Tax=Periconia macrospinosa TaxID=97972 RepID=A0A2V1D4D8_9PLEO|nr:hypothetical protein DM02DRAFT_662547 [Periconia macrospinosa]